MCFATSGLAVGPRVKTYLNYLREKRIRVQRSIDTRDASKTNFIGHQKTIFADQ
jgi:hypothetical protein